MSTANNIFKFLLTEHNSNPKTNMIYKMAISTAVLFYLVIKLLKESISILTVSKNAIDKS